MDLRKLTEAQKARLRTCGSEDELRALAEEQGIELTDDQLEAVSAGDGYITCRDKAPLQPFPVV